jgi:diguanylate cyclase
MFLAIKIKLFIQNRKHGITVIKILSPIFFSLLSIMIMHYPLRFNDIYFDLRDVPIFTYSYIIGWKYGPLSIILPAIYRLYIGGPNAQLGILLGVLLPCLIGCYFHNSNELEPVLTNIDLKKFIKAYIVFHVIHKLLMLSLDISFTTWLTVSAIMTVMSIIAAVSISLMINDANENFNIKNKLEYQSNHDFLTKLPNLRCFISQVNELIKKRTDIAIAMIDIDFFKNYNDTHGHPAGDKVLRNLAVILENQTRNSQDLIARYGGEEFIVCFTNISDYQMAYTLAERIRKSIEEYPFEGQETQPNGTLTVSIGVSIISGDKTLEEGIQQADEALYKSKRTGRNKVSFYENIASSCI